MNAPKLEANKCSVAIAEYKTGKVFKRNLSVFQGGENESDVFQVFNDFTQAKEFVVKFIKANSDFECTICNDQGEHVATFDPTGERKME